MFSINIIIIQYRTLARSAPAQKLPLEPHKTITFCEESASKSLKKD